jgi:hypothetical protein
MRMLTKLIGLVGFIFAVLPIFSVAEQLKEWDGPQLRCNQSECNTSLVWLITTHRGKVALEKDRASEAAVATCTGVVIDKNVIATNSHCLPKQVKEGEKCAELVRIFHGYGDKTHRAPACRRVIAATDFEAVQNIGELSPDRAERADYAFIELDAPINAPALMLSNDGPSVDEDVTLLALDPFFEAGVQGGIYSKKKCFVIRGSLIAPHFTGPKSSIAPLFGRTTQDCGVVPGNSGGAVIGKDGRLLGLVSAYQNGHTNFAAGGLFSNLSCVDFKASPLSVQDRCDNSRKQHILPEPPELMFRFLRETSQNFPDYLFRFTIENVRNSMPVSEYFDFSKKQNIATALVIATLVCIKPGAAMETAEISLPYVMDLQFAIELNRYYVPIGKVEKSISQEWILSSENGSGKPTIRERKSAYEAEQASTSFVRFCGEKESMQPFVLAAAKVEPPK